MKKAAVFIFTVFIFTFFLSGCAPTGYPNILSFTDSFNRISDDERIALTDYIIIDKSYKLLFEKENFSALLTAETNEKDDIKKIRLSIAKTDNSGKTVIPTDAQAYFFFEKAVQILSSFTHWDKEKCSSLIKKILPSEGKNLLKTGELTLENEKHLLIYYSNEICCQFTVINTFLEKNEATQKPVSRPLFEVTANILQQG